MRQAELKRILEAEATQWSRMPYSEVAAIAYPVVRGAGKEGAPDYYQTEITLLERKVDYIQLSISISDAGFSSLVPVTTSVVILAKSSEHPV